MEKRSLGTSGLAVAPLVFGTNCFGWTTDDKMAFTLLDAFVDAGFNTIDTSDIYAHPSHWATNALGGEAEAIIGRWFRSRGGRDRIVISTKVGLDRFDPAIRNLSKAYLLKAAEETLRRLQTEYIDLYQSHRDDPGTPIEETLEAYDQLVRQGKVRVIGASNFEPERLRRSLEISDRHRYPRYRSVQQNYNLYDRASFEAGIAPLCRAESLGALCYPALAGGFLTGTYRTEADIVNAPRANFVRRYMDERGMRILNALDDVAAQLSAKPSQIAIAWLVARPGVTGAIASASNPAELEELIAATQLKLHPQAIDALDRASAPRQEVSTLQ